MIILPLEFSFSGLWNSVSSFFSDKIYEIIDRLPGSPFSSFELPSLMQQYLGYINWFIPVGTLLAILGGWVTAIGVYYLISAILRIFKVIEG